MTKHETLTAAIAPTDVVTITPRIGAEIRNVKLSGDLPDTLVAEIKTLLARHKVVFFRDQGHLDDAGQEAFARLLGDLAPHPTQPVHDGTTAVLELDSHQGTRADQWHTDVTFLPAYPKYSVLRGIVIPETGGDTIWANTATAYDSLPEAFRQLADNLRAVHSNTYDYASARPRATEVEKERYEKVFRSTKFQTEHPLVHVHPETQERNLLLGSFVQRIVGLNKSETQAIYDLFQRYITAPENTVRWHWQPGDVAIWDNRATQHLAVNDYGDAHRVVRRVTIDGDVPTAANGQPSRAL